MESIAKKNRREEKITEKGARNKEGCRVIWGKRKGKREQIKTNLRRRHVESKEGKGKEGKEVMHETGKQQKAEKRHMEKEKQGRSA